MTNPARIVLDGDHGGLGAGGRRMPTTAMISIATVITVAMSMSAQMPPCPPVTARTEGPNGLDPADRACDVGGDHQPPGEEPEVRLMARPTHSKLAAQLAFHMFSRRYAFAMMSIGGRSR